jgi:hypothetical protein
MTVEAQEIYLAEREAEIANREEMTREMESDLVAMCNALQLQKEKIQESKDLLEVEQMALIAFKHMNSLD